MEQHVEHWVMNFKRIIMLAGVAAAAATAQTALAADLPAQRAYTAPAVVAPVSNWTGFYVGGGIGYGLMDVESHTNAPGFASSRLTATPAAGVG